MKRSSWKLTFIKPTLMKSRFLTMDKSIKNLWFRNSTIPFFMVGRRVRIYNGIWFLVQNVTNEMIGSKFGEFSLTKRIDSQVKSRMKVSKKTKKS